MSTFAILDATLHFHQHLRALTVQGLQVQLLESCADLQDAAPEIQIPDSQVANAASAPIASSMWWIVGAATALLLAAAIGYYAHAQPSG